MDIRRLARRSLLLGRLLIALITTVRRAVLHSLGWGAGMIVWWRALRQCLLHAEAGYARSPLFALTSSLDMCFAGATALHAAAFNGQLACVLVLVEEGADTMISDNDNLTAVDQAENESHADICTFLRAMGSLI